MMDIRKDRKIKIAGNGIIANVLALIISLTNATAQNSTEHFIEDFVSLDSSIRSGTLENGFRYFIKPVSAPDKKVSMYFYLKAGSDQEDSDQLNIAHAIEHLAFKGTEHWPSGIRNSGLLNKLGLNMYSFSGSSGPRATQYSFTAPTASMEALDFGLKWFRDIAAGIDLSDEKIDRVRGELRQEFIGKLGDNLQAGFAELKLYEDLFPCSGNFSNFFEHHQNFDPSVVRRYYKDWYRPDLMGLVVVGNIENPNDLEREIHENFESLKSPNSSREFKNCDSLYYSLPKQFSLVERKQVANKPFQNKSVELHLIFRDERIMKNLKTLDGVKDLMKLDLLIALVNDRYEEATNDYKSPDMYSGHLLKNNSLPPGMEVLLKMDKNQEEKTIKKAVRILREIGTYGFLQEEWEHAKGKRLNSMANSGTESTTYWMNEIEKFFIYGETLPYKKAAYLEAWLSNLSLSEFNTYVKEFLSEEPQDIGLIVPAGLGANYKEKEFRNWINEGYSSSIEPYEATETLKSLMDTEEIDALRLKDYQDFGPRKSGARKILLDNGVKVVLVSNSVDSNSFGNRIKIHGFSNRGASCFSPAKYSSAISAPAIVRNSGVNGINKFQLSRFLSSSGLYLGSVIPYIDNFESGIQAETKLEDLEVALQLIYLYYTKPNQDKGAFEDWIIEETKAYENPSYNLIQLDFHNEIRDLTVEKSLGSIVEKFPKGTKRFDAVSKTDFEDAYKVYKNLFGNAEEFTFIINGNFEMESVMPLIQKYLGNLPSSSVHCNLKEGMDFSKLPKGPQIMEINAPGYYNLKSTNYGLMFIRNAEDPIDWREQIKVEALGEITSKKAWALRFGKGYSFYMIYVKGNFNKEMQRYELSIFVDCVPEEYEMIKGEISEIIEELKTKIVSGDEFKMGINTLFRKYARKTDNPQELQQRLYELYKYGYSLKDPSELESYIKSLTAENILETANKYFLPQYRYEFVMREN